MAFKNTMHYFHATPTESKLCVVTYLNILLRQDITAKKDKTKYHTLSLKMFIKDGKLQLQVLHGYQFIHDSGKILFYRMELE
jgi:hypothetical protein